MPKHKTEPFEISVNKPDVVMDEKRSLGDLSHAPFLIAKSKWNHTHYVCTDRFEYLHFLCSNFVNSFCHQLVRVMNWPLSIASMCATAVSY